MGTTFVRPGQARECSSEIRTSLETDDLRLGNPHPSGWASGPECNPDWNPLVADGNRGDHNSPADHLHIDLELTLGGTK